MKHVANLNVTKLITSGLNKIFVIITGITINGT